MKKHYHKSLSLIDQDIIFEKTAIIERCLKRITETSGLNPQRLDDINIQDIFVLNLIRAIQAAIDLAAHIIADEGLGLPGSLREHFTMLKKAGVLKGDLAKKMEAMVGFRNIAVHEYQSIEVDILKSILKTNLADLESYYRAIFNYYHLS